MANQYTKTVVDMDRLIFLYQQGMTQLEVAEEMGLTQKVVCSRLREANVCCRRSGHRNQQGALNPNWGGLDVGYTSFHNRLRALKGKPKHCEVCGTSDPSRTYDWANLSGRYDDPTDYKRMCRSCHWKHDGTIKNFKGRKAVGYKQYVHDHYKYLKEKE